MYNGVNLRALEICIHPSVSNIGGLVSSYICEDFFIPYRNCFSQNVVNKECKNVINPVQSTFILLK
jgi:hypothetical protein